MCESSRLPARRTRRALPTQGTRAAPRTAKWARGRSWRHYPGAPNVNVEPTELTTSSFPIRWASRTKASTPVQCWGTT